MPPKNEEQITDKALDEAAALLGDEQETDETNEQSQELEQENDEKKPDEKDEINFEDLLEKKLQETRSDWGRKLSASEKQITELTGMVKNLVSIMEAGQQKDIQEDDTIPLTKSELVQFLEERDKKLQQTKQKYDAEYENGYMGEFEKLTSNLSENAKSAIRQLVWTPNGEFCVRYSDDPAADAERNFLKAKIALMEKAVERKKNPLKGEKQTLPLGGAAGSDNDFKSNQTFQLDDYAADFIKSQGLDEKFVQKALSGNAPNYIAGAFAKKGVNIQ